MTDPTPSPASDSAESAPAPRGRRRWPVVVAGILVVPILLSGIYTALVLTWSYSDGDRAGSLFKFSRKGWICKTWEGELNITPTAAAPTIWKFSVRENDVARQINQALGRPVVLHYAEHRGVPSSCFGETSYFVDAVKPVGQ